MFYGQLLIGTLMIVATVGFHASALVMLAAALTKARAVFKLRLRPGFYKMLLLNIAVLGVIAIHTTEAWSWAALFLALGEFESVKTALYFSVVTATTLGYGDLLLSPKWQILGSFESMGGLILFGASTGFLLELMHELFGVIDRD